MAVILADISGKIVSVMHTAELVREYYTPIHALPYELWIDERENDKLLSELVHSTDEFRLVGGTLTRLEELVTPAIDTEDREESERLNANADVDLSAISHDTLLSIVTALAAQVNDLRKRERDRISGGR